MQGKHRRYVADRVAEPAAKADLRVIRRQKMNITIARFRDFFGDLARAKRARDTYFRLDALSDATLAARGLTRGGDLARKAIEDSAGN
jgi:hypothetical protein